MLDIKYIKENKKLVIDKLKARQVDHSTVDKILVLDGQRRQNILELEKIRAEKNLFNKTITKLKAEKKSKKIQEMTELTKKENELEDKLNTINDTFNKLLNELPNLPADDVTIGKDETENVIHKTTGQPKKINFKIKDHLQLGEELDLIDIKTAAKVSGSRFGYLKNKAVQLEFALIQFTFDTLIKEKFQPIIPPVMIKEEIMEGLGYLSNHGEEEMYHFTKDKLFFIGTAEHSLVPLHADEILKEKELPKRYLGFSTCFRREAGSYGKDTKGILRVHQFDKVEMVSFSKPEDSLKEQEFLLSLSEKLVKVLEIPYRIVKMCTGDLAPPSARTYDIECWIPSENKYRETHSISNCTDYQARRLKIRYNIKNGKNEFVHTLNGTAFAIGRMLIAILENYQQKDGSILIPHALQQYCSFKSITRKK